MSTQIEREMMLEDQANGASAGKLARVYGTLPFQTFVPPPRPYPVLSEDGLGRQELRQFIVDVKHVNSSWPRISQAVYDAYDDGTVDVCQGRDGDTIILYAIPRQRVDRERRPYFSRQFGIE